MKTPGPEPIRFHGSTHITWQTVALTNALSIRNLNTSSAQQESPQNQESGTALVRRRVSELRGREADAAVGDIEHVVEALQERHAVDEVQALAADAPQVVHDEVD